MDSSSVPNIVYYAVAIQGIHTYTIDIMQHVCICAPYVCKYIQYIYMYMYNVVVVS
jgi:hypothetical protein